MTTHRQRVLEDTLWHKGTSYTQRDRDQRSGKYAMLGGCTRLVGALRTSATCKIENSKSKTRSCMLELNVHFLQLCFVHIRYYTSLVTTVRYGHGVKRENL